MERHLCLIAALCALSAGTAANAAAPGLYITARDTGQRLAQAPAPVWSDLAQPPEKDDAVFVDPSQRYQPVIGIGGALTDAAAETFDLLPAAKQEEVLDAYYNPERGIGYTLGRTSIHSCDFSSESYTYVADGDTALASFSIAHDLRHRVPFIRKAIAAAGGKLTLFASPWSPPAWMKDNHSMLHGGRLLPEYYDAWARYYARFIEAYAAQGIPIWGITVQNEPMAIQTWESCVYTAQDERDFVREHLGPTLERTGHGNVHLMIWDHNRTMMYQRAQVVLEDPAAARYVWGVAFHWYVDDSFDNVARVHEAFPSKHLLFSEGCEGPFDPARLGDWKWGEDYARAMIHDFTNGVEAWTDWNVLLDETGGPNHVSNFCFAPIIAVRATGELRYMSSYYYIGHFSKFVRPGARRIGCSPTIGSLASAAFLNPDGTVAVIVMNETPAEHRFLICLGGKAAPLTLPGHAILTALLP